MPSMRAARFDREGRNLAVKDVPVPEPGLGEVLVRVRACGICLSDVHLIDGSLPAPLPEVTPGHEAAGVIEAIGPGVPGWQPGQRVVIAGGRPCWRCRNCIGAAPASACSSSSWAPSTMAPGRSTSSCPTAR